MASLPQLMENLNLLYENKKTHRVLQKSRSSNQAQGGTFEVPRRGPMMEPEGLKLSLMKFNWKT